MKYILILLISFAFGQVTFVPIQTHIVEWCLRYEVPDPCPGYGGIDEFGRDNYSNISCLVYHFHYEKDCNHHKIFNNYDEAKEFADRANKENDIIDVKLDGVLIPKPVRKWEGIDSLDITFMDISVTSLDLSLIGESFIDEYGEDEISLTSDISLMNEEMRLIQPITFDNILQYAEECYNDSTWVETSLYMRATEMFSHYDFYREDSEVVWLRKTPTFSGFIEWCKRSK